MKLQAFCIQKNRCVQDSGWVDVSPLTVLVGKNESGKTALLKALHKFKPFSPEPYSMDAEWPRGYRRDRDPKHVVCSARFILTQEEQDELGTLAEQVMPPGELAIEITKDYEGRFEVYFPGDLFPDRIHPNDIDHICEALPAPPPQTGEAFRKTAEALAAEARRLAHEGRFTELAELHPKQIAAFSQVRTPADQAPVHQNEENFVQKYGAQLQQIAQKLTSARTVKQKAHEFIVSHIPTFIYMSDYRTFTGAAHLDQVKQRKDQNKLTEEDRTLLMIMKLAGLTLDDEVKKGNSDSREQRQYDLDDASATLTREISERWRQRRYEIQFRADGQYFFTFVKDEKDPSLIKLEERSKGFQWFFSFDLMFMHESAGTFKDCVILLDEPGLHLHPDAQKDLLNRMQEYAKGNTLIYSTHLPFMLDLRRPEDIRIIEETLTGTVVTADFTRAQPAARFVLQAALGMSGSSSYLVAQRNLVVEGVDDYWILTELARILTGLGGDPFLPADVHVTPAGGASEAAYIATFMIGQKLEVVVLLDSDRAGVSAKDDLVKKWLTHYQGEKAHVLLLGELLTPKQDDVSIEDLFPPDFYLEVVKEVYTKQLAAVAANTLVLDGGGQVVRQVARAFEALGLDFNRGPVAKVLRKRLAATGSSDNLPAGTKEKASGVLTAIRDAFNHR